MNIHPRSIATVAVVACMVALVSCSAATDLLSKPAPEDPLDGNEGSLAEAGVNTEMDWGPQQETLLEEYSAAREEQARLRKQIDEMLEENQKLKASLVSERDALEAERKNRVQSDAEVARLRRQRQQLEAKILALGIEKHKVEQENLLRKIATMERSLQDMSTNAANPAEAAAPLGGKQ